MNAQVIVRGGFDDIRARDIRFLEDAAKLGNVTVVKKLMFLGSSCIYPVFGGAADE